MKINYDPAVDRVARVMRCAAWRDGGASFPSLSDTVSYLISVPLGKKVHPRIMPLMTADGEERQSVYDSRHTGGRHGNNLIIMSVES